MLVRPGEYREKVERSRERGIQASITGRDIAKDYPPPGDLETRKACEFDFKRFCIEYFPNVFHLKMSPDHLKVIAKMENVILEGGLYSLAMPRASGKSSLAMRCSLWALLYGHRRMVCLIGATEEKARALLKDLKTEIQFNERLARDFRQVCYPINCLENNGRRCIGQIFNGRQTRIGWGDDHLTFPTMPDSACDGLNVSGYTVTVGGLTGALRGQSHTLLNGTVIRPEVVILDDPQTRESAMSVTQSEKRSAIIHGDVLGMSGPDREISAILCATVIRAGDMASDMLDRTKTPEWSGELTKMVYSFPTNMQLWEAYNEIRKEEFQAGTDHKRSDAFYAKQQKTMDSGCILAWPERKGKNSISAVQHCMNLFFRDQRSFHAEMQNTPLPEEGTRPDDLTPDGIMARINRHAKGVVPLKSEKLTAFIDVQQECLFWAVCAWEEGFTGAVISYGCFPDQRTHYVNPDNLRFPISKVIHAPDIEGRWFGALEALTNDILGREWMRDGDGVAFRVEKCMIDANFGSSTDTVYRFARASVFSNVIVPSHGKYIGASSSPMRDWTRRPGEKTGMGWKLRAMQQRRAVRSVVFDTNMFKSFLHSRLSVPVGSRSALTLYGDRPDAHRMIADHLTSEYRVRVMVKNGDREIDEWKNRPEKPRNDFFDCLVGCCVGASMCGIALDEKPAAKVVKPRRVSFSELQRNKQQPRP